MNISSQRWLYLLIIASFYWSGCKAQHNGVEDAEHMQEANKRSIVSTLKEHAHLSVSDQADLYRQLKKDSRDGYDFENEDELTMYGYGMLWNDRPSDAFIIFQLIAEQFPQSSNAYDSLGEAYYVLGNKEKALENYQKSLDMNPDNYNAEDYIDLINHPDKKRLTPAERFSEVYTVEAYRADLDDLAHKLKKTHPAIFKFTSEAAFRQIVEKNKQLINKETTYGMFRWYCNEVIASVNCSHTDMGDFYLENEMLPMSLRFPVQTHWVDDNLYVVDPLSNGHALAIHCLLYTSPSPRD